MPCPQNPAAVSIVTGSILNDGVLQLGCTFYWANPTYEAVSIAGCGGFCTQSTYEVSGRQAGFPYAITEATLLPQATSWSFGPETPNKWNAPGQPRILMPPYPSPMNEAGESGELDEHEHHHELKKDVA
jgi:hypothetical protein